MNWHVRSYYVDILTFIEKILDILHMTPKLEEKLSCYIWDQTEKIDSDYEREHR